ncbi:hypothetical protein [Nocardia brevicatena]|uniref:hypothetical protein n=1 Tax=Nocardia brevicatena TaxID=37327 RepID=UPI001FE1B0B6|nr:hypothetical protein [Nocardia brevicatena]
MGAFMATAHAEFTDGTAEMITIKRYLDRLPNGPLIFCVFNVEPSCPAVFKDELPKLLPHDNDADRLTENAYHFAESFTAFDIRPPALPGAKALLWGTVTSGRPVMWTPIGDYSKRWERRCSRSRAVAVDWPGRGGSRQVSTTSRWSAVSRRCCRRSARRRRARS